MPFPIALSALFGLLASPKALAEVRDRIVDGIPITEHIDENDSPCGHRGHKNGCYVNQDGKHNIWYSEVGPEYIFQHELAHAKGMKHDEWKRMGLFGSDWCAEITAPAPNYTLGDLVCNNGGREYFMRRGLLDPDVFEHVKK